MTGHPSADLRYLVLGETPQSIRRKSAVRGRGDAHSVIRMPRKRVGDLGVLCSPW